MNYRPREMAERLGISASTLRLWSNQFADVLSNYATKAPTGDRTPAAQRRYTDDDLRTLLRAKALLAQGLTYEETKRRLSQDPPPQQAPPLSDKAAPPEEALPSLQALRETIEAKDKTIAALRDSLAFLDVYLFALRQEREDAKQNIHRLEREVAELRARADALTRELQKPWWKRLLGLP